MFGNVKELEKKIQALETTVNTLSDHLEGLQNRLDYYLEYEKKLDTELRLKGSSDNLDQLEEKELLQVPVGIAIYGGDKTKISIRVIGCPLAYLLEGIPESNYQKKECGVFVMDISNTSVENRFRENLQGMVQKYGLSYSGNPYFQREKYDNY